jgi:hypothetical protein
MEQRSVAARVTYVSGTICHLMSQVGHRIAMATPRRCICLT